MKEITKNDVKRFKVHPSNLQYPADLYIFTIDQLNEFVVSEIESFIKENYVEKGFAKWLANELEYDFEGAYEVWKEHNIKDK